MLLDKHCIGNKGMILIKGRDVIIIMRKKKKIVGQVWYESGVPMYEAHMI